MHRPHALRDPVHGYIRLTDGEIRGIDTPQVQRLRGISQLGLTERVYPGARHTRFEHALGALEVATRILESLRGRVGRETLLAPLGIDDDEGEYEHLLSVVRWVGLLHDLGHSPFSHVTESLLPTGSDHESLSAELVEHTEVGDALGQCGVQLRADVLAVLRDDTADLPPSLRFAREIIMGPVGADRMDYLLRDSRATGVSYGIFDLDRVLHTLALCPHEAGRSDEAGLRLGIRPGGVLAVEGMLWARFSMFQQVYFHPTRRILDRHLNDFLETVLPGGRYPGDLDEYQQWNDARVWELLRVAAQDGDHPGIEDARRIMERRHHRALPQELTSEDARQLEVWLHDWASRVIAEQPDAMPIADLVIPTADASGGEELPVVESAVSERIVPLRERSALVGRLRLSPVGRLYVRPGAGDFPFSGTQENRDGVGPATRGD